MTPSAQFPVTPYSGALCYAELAMVLGRSGGEYLFLTEIYGRPFGFVAGWITIIAGYAAPAALAAMALGGYLNHLFPGLSSVVVAESVLAGTTILHLVTPRFGLAFQTGFTILKVAAIMVIIAAGAFCAPMGDAGFQFHLSDASMLTTPAFATALVFVMYAYSGWNASTYIASDVLDPKRNIHRSLVIGTVLVMILYLGLNWVILRSTPIAILAGRDEAALAAANLILGPRLSLWMGGLLALLLISSISAMIWLGPRGIKTMGEDHPALAWLAKSSGKGVPVWAMLFQSSISMLLIATGAYASVLVYAQGLLLLCTLLSALGVIVLRLTRPDLPRSYRTWGYPIPPLLFSGVTVWMLMYQIRFQPIESMLAIATVAVGLVLYFISHSANREISRTGAMKKSKLDKGRSVGEVDIATEYTFWSTG